LRAVSITKRSPSRRMIASSPGSSNSKRMRTAWLRPSRNNLTRFYSSMTTSGRTSQTSAAMRPLTRDSLGCPWRRAASQLSRFPHPFGPDGQITSPFQLWRV
jgi:hypothetical protein